MFVMGGMSLAAVGNQHVYLKACYASMSFAVPILALRYAVDGHMLEPLLLLLFTAVILRLANMLARFSERTSQLQFERDALLDELSRRATELESAKLEAEQANQAKSRFLAQASHDLRQPMHAIGLFVDTLAHDELGDKVAQVVNKVSSSLASLSRLFDSLLDITQLDTRSGHTVPRNFKLNELFDSLQRDFRPIAQENGVQLVFVNPDIAVHTDPILFRRLLQNLVSNAIRYAPQEKVTVTAAVIGTTCSVSVEDSGAGIDAADQQRIFDEFVRLDTGTNTAPGLGLGLSIVKRLERLLKLQLTMHSAAGVGTCFTVSGLTLAAGEVETLSDETAAAPTNILQDTTVVVVDDDPDVLQATAELLTRWGCTVRSYQEPPASIGDAEIVISDYELGDELNGLDSITRWQLENPTLAAVLISGNTSQDLKRSARTADIPLLHKPVRPVQLRSALLFALTRSVADIRSIS